VQMTTDSNGDCRARVLAAAARRFLVVAALPPAARRFRVVATLRAAALRFRATAAFSQSISPWRRSVSSSSRLQTDFDGRL